MDHLSLLPGLIDVAANGSWMDQVNIVRPPLGGVRSLNITVQFGLDSVQFNLSRF